MTQICRSKKEVEAFKDAVTKIRKAWFYIPDTPTYEAMEATNDLMADLFNEIEDFLGIPQGN